MKKRIYKYLMVGVVVYAASGVSGCKKGWLDINSNPNAAVESNITPDLVLSSSLLNTANRSLTGFGFLQHWMGYWCPAANYAPNVEEQSYNITTNFGVAQFEGYMDINNDIAFMERKANETGQEFFEGIAKILKSHNFGNLVDLYNQVPYTEALKGTEFIRPKYDDGKAIYEDLIAQIDAGIALIKKADASRNLNISSSDIMFHGDKTLWIKFANTLKLRLLMHQSGRADRAAYIQSEINKIVTEGSGFLGSGQSAAVNPGYQQDKPSAYYANYGFTLQGTIATDFWRANIIGMNFLKNNADPRLAGFYKPIAQAAGTTEPFTQPPPSNYRGNEYGLPINNIQYPYQTFNYVSQVGGIAAAGAVSGSSQGIIKGYNMPGWIIPSFESFFLQAEAIQRGWLPGNAKAAYEAAVKESFIWLNMGGSTSAATSAFNAWYADADANNNVNVSFDDATDKLKLIWFQKYISQIGVLPLETWTDYRRNGAYPTIPLSANPGRTSTTLPVRILFPQRELNLNEENVPAVGRNAGDQFTGKIWWMP